MSASRYCEKCLRPVHQAIHAFTGQRVPIVCPASYMAASPGDWVVWTVTDALPYIDYTAPAAMLGVRALKPDAHAWRGDVHECYGGER